MCVYISTHTCTYTHTHIFDTYFIYTYTHLYNLFLSELTDGDSTTYPSKLFHKLFTRTVKKFLLMLVLHCHVLTESLCPLDIVSLNVNNELTVVIVVTMKNFKCFYH